MNNLYRNIAAPYMRNPQQDVYRSLPDYQRGVTLAAPASYGSLLGMPMQPVQPTPPAPMITPATLAPATPQRQPQRSLLTGIAPPPARPKRMSDSFLGGVVSDVGEGLRGAGKELKGLFEGDEGRARAAALSRSLLRGPSRTPVSFGQSLAEGLAEGGAEIERQAVRKAKMEQLSRTSKQQKQKDEALKVLAKKDATPKEIMGALRVIDPSAYAKAMSKDKSLNQVKADFLLNLKETNPAEYRRLATKSIEGNVDFLTALLRGDAPESGGASVAPPTSHEEANQRAKDAGQSTYVYEGKTYKVQ